MKTCKNLLNCLLLIGAMMFASDTFAQKVIFPQQEQPGIAEVSETDGVYTLSNGLFSASFIKEEGKLMFNGCEELGLLPGTEFFEVKLADGTVMIGVSNGTYLSSADGTIATAGSCTGLYMPKTRHVSSIRGTRHICTSLTAKNSAHRTTSYSVTVQQGS